MIIFGLLVDVCVVLVMLIVCNLWRFCISLICRFLLMLIGIGLRLVCVCVCWLVISWSEVCLVL